MDPQLHPNANQRRFFEQYILGEESTILTLKLRAKSPRGFAVNVRGPFKLVEYQFHDPEAVIDATWADEPGATESRCHLHCCWADVRVARLFKTNQAVREHIGYEWELDFFASEEDGKSHDPRKDDRRLFWFYLKDESHKAVQNLRAQQGQFLSVL